MTAHACHSVALILQLQWERWEVKWSRSRQTWNMSSGCVLSPALGGADAAAVDGCAAGSAAPPLPADARASLPAAQPQARVMPAVLGCSVDPSRCGARYSRDDTQC